MNKIAFKNFRKFIEFPPLTYSGITFLVGRNNSGKSTLVKALLLLDNYFKTGDFERFNFENIEETVKIGSYERAKNNQTQDNYISFTFEISNYRVEILISHLDKYYNKYYFAEVHTFKISTIHSDELSFNFNMRNKYLTIEKRKIDFNNQNHEDKIDKLKKEIEEIEKQLEIENIKRTSVEYIELNTRKSRLEREIEEITEKGEKINESNNYEFILEGVYNEANSIIEAAKILIDSSTKEYEQEFNNIQNGHKASAKFKDLRALKEYTPKKLVDFLRFFFLLTDRLSVDYLSIGNIETSALYTIRDKDNPLAKTIHEFAQNELNEDFPNFFVREWMEKFEIGTSFRIIAHAGEAYEFIVSNKNEEIHLADMGRGSIQIMQLILRISCIIEKIKKKKGNNSGFFVNDRYNNHINFDRIAALFSTVIIEEPELNLHPALQSKLADFFLEVHEEYGLNFIIETHSEYVLRRSQVLVAEKEFEVEPRNNPFNVYYFPLDSNHSPYSLEYQEDGSFVRNFGDGFFDEASSSTLELLKLKRQKKA